MKSFRENELIKNVANNHGRKRRNMVGFCVLDSQPFVELIQLPAALTISAAGLNARAGSQLEEGFGPVGRGAFRRLLFIAS